MLVQGLRLLTPNTEGPGSTLVREKDPTSCNWKIPCAATKIQHHQTNRYKKTHESTWELKRCCSNGKQRMLQPSRQHISATGQRAPRQLRMETDNPPTEAHAAVSLCSHPDGASEETHDAGPRQLKCVSQEWLQWAQTHIFPYTVNQGFPGLQCRRPSFDPWVGKIPLETGMVTHSNILAWRIPWAEEPGRLQSMRSTDWFKIGKGVHQGCV